MRTYETKWCGVHIEEEDGHYWIVTDNGWEEYIGTTQLAEEEIDDIVSSMV